MRLGKRSIAAVVCLAAVGVATCKEEVTAPTVEADLTVAVTTSTVPALQGTTFFFSSAGSVLSSQLAGKDVTLAFSNTSSSTPTATITVNSQTLTATTTFGSCTFTWTGAGVGIALALGIPQPKTIDPCTFNVDLKGKTYNSSNLPANIAMGLGPFASAIVATGGTVSIDDQGNVTVTTPGGTTITVGHATGTG